MPAALRDYEGLYIDGRWLPTREAEPVLNPATEGVIARAPVGDAGGTERAIVAARKAFDEGPWPRMRHAERSRILQRFHDVLASRADELTALVVAETGASQMIARFVHVGVSLKIFQTMIELAGRREPMTALPPLLVPDFSGKTKLGMSIKVREPAGVVAAITPFNFPLFLNLVKAGPALAMGCTMVLKPSPYTPLEAFLLGDVADEVGLPPGVLNVVTGGAEIGQGLTTDPRIDLVTFTGSDLVGAAVMGQAAPSLKRVLLELGGKSALIVRPDADLAAAAMAGVSQLTVQAGQGCALCTRHLVHRDVHDAYVAQLAEMMRGVPVGDPADAGVMMGPLIRERQRARVEHYVAEGKKAGAALVTGGRRPPSLAKGFFYEPTLFTGTNAMSIAQDEIFGPVGVVIPFESDDEAVAIANDSQYGLSAAVWSGDVGAAFEIARRLRTGNVGINGGAGEIDARAPFGGFKRSGIGREWGEEGLDEYTELKTISFAAG